MRRWTGWFYSRFRLMRRRQADTARREHLRLASESSATTDTGRAFVFRRRASRGIEERPSSTKLTASGGAPYRRRAWLTPRDRESMRRPVARVELIRTTPRSPSAATWFAWITLDGLEARRASQPRRICPAGVDMPSRTQSYSTLEALLSDINERVQELRGWWPEVEVTVTHHASPSAAAALARDHGVRLPR